MFSCDTFTGIGANKQDMFCMKRIRTNHKQTTRTLLGIRSFQVSLGLWYLLLLYAGCKYKNYLERLTPYLERLCVRFFTLAVSNIPLTIWYRTPGRSLTLPPLTKTIECS